MSYKSKIWADGVEYRPYIFLQLPSKLSKPDSIAMYDRSAAEDIKRLEEIIEDLKEYRQDLAARYAELEVMAYTQQLELKRYRSYIDKHVTYSVKLIRTFTDGTQQEILAEQFTGQERREAFKRFEQLLKQYPGINSVKDVEPARWERR